jgi:hypothetical protein
MSVAFSGEIEAENEAEAEKLAWTSWGDTLDADLTYEGVDEISVEEIEDEEEEEEE